MSGFSEGDMFLMFYTRTAKSKTGINYEEDKGDDTVAARAHDI